MNTIRQQLLSRSEIKNHVEIKHEMRPLDNNVTSMSRAERRNE